MVDTFMQWQVSGHGPTGWRAERRRRPRITNWTTLAAADPSAKIVFLNENAARSTKCVLDDVTCTFYLHVDDGVFASTDALRSASDMHAAADGLCEAGFVVTDRQDKVTKIVGYEVLEDPATLRLPLAKAGALKEALRWVASRPMVQVDVLHSLLGIWLFGALLDRNLLCVPFHIFRFVTKCEGLTVPWWPSVRREVQCMASLTVFFFCDAGRPAVSTIFASDAMGAGENDAGDAGGFGIVSKEIDPGVTVDIWRRGFQTGLSVTRLDGTLGSKWSAKKAVSPTVPFSRLPDSVFDENWEVLAQDRWKWRDHITLGEGRAHVRIISALASVSGAHRARVLALEDNAPVSFSMAKGRSPSEPLNFLCRRRGALCLAAQFTVATPWVETSRMPADDASRDRAAPARPLDATASQGGNGATLQEGSSALPLFPH